MMLGSLLSILIELLKERGLAALKADEVLPSALAYFCHKVKGETVYGIALRDTERASEGDMEVIRLLLCGALGVHPLSVVPLQPGAYTDLGALDFRLRQLRKDCFGLRYVCSSNAAWLAKKPSCTSRQ